MSENAKGRGKGDAAQAAGRARAAARRRERVDKRVRDLSLTAVYWLFFMGMLALTIVTSLLIVALLFRFRIFQVPGPVLLLGAFTVITVIVGTLFSQVVIRNITRPILEMSDAAQRMAEGDFDIELTEKTVAVEVRQMAESFMRMASELSQTEMLRADFVSNVSHEMKTPVATIKGYAALLERPGLSEEDRRLYAAKILAATERLSGLTDNTLLLSQLEHADLELERAPFALDEQLREAVLAFGPRWDEGRALELELEEVVCMGNEGLLTHVWQNLIGNALKFTEPGDTITVRCGRIADGAQGAPARIVVQVADTGCGMDADACARAFEKFYQADRSHGTEGNGLGLALAKRIVDLHGGEIGVESSPGAGAVFTVTLPAR